jgi:hypothetical protein
LLRISGLFGFGPRPASAAGCDDFVLDLPPLFVSVRRSAALKKGKTRPSTKHQQTNARASGENGRHVRVLCAGSSDLHSTPPQPLLLPLSVRELKERPSATH